MRKPKRTVGIEPCDLSSDPVDRRNLAAENPGVVERTKAFLERAHTPDPRWVLQ